ncbi:MAG: aminotransferase class III-fold pyridoxal phosphate-dependent enzyme, partial [Peptostreptococcaceae bacterium]
ICAVDNVAKTFSKGTHGSTYAGSPVCCAAAYAQINELLDNNLADRAQEMGEYFSNKLKTLPTVKEVRGKGLLVGVEFEDAIGADVKHHCIDNKLLVTLIGDRIIRMVPPLILTEEHCDKAFEVLYEAVEHALASAK